MRRFFAVFALFLGLLGSAHADSLFPMVVGEVISNPNHDPKQMLIVTGCDPNNRSVTVHTWLAAGYKTVSIGETFIAFEDSRGYRKLTLLKVESGPTCHGIFQLNPP